MDPWEKWRSRVRDVVVIVIGAYIAFRAAEPPITVEDLPAFTAAAGFLGVPFVARSGKDE